MSQNVLRFAKTPKTAMKTFSNTSHQMYSIFILMLNNLTICQPSSFFFSPSNFKQTSETKFILALLLVTWPGLAVHASHACVVYTEAETDT